MRWLKKAESQSRRWLYYTSLAKTNPADKPDMPAHIYDAATATSSLRRRGRILSAVLHIGNTFVDEALHQRSPIMAFPVSAA